MKSCTDLEQSCKLAEILPLETADMYYSKYDTIHAATLYSSCDSEYFKIHEYIPCWSLAALLDAIPDSIYDNTNEFSQLEFSKRSIAYHDLNDEIKIGSLYDNLVDACVEMIIKLHELNLL